MQILYHLGIALLLIIVFGGSVRAEDPHWTFDPYAYQYDMTVFATVAANGAVASNLSDYEVAAFCEDECRGIASVQTVGSNNYCYLRIRSNRQSGETITFKVYQASTATERVVTEQQLEFKSQNAIGIPSNPYVLDLKVVTLDENSTTAPELMENLINVSIQRSIIANIWNTICLPFTMTKAMVEEVFGSNVELAAFQGFTTTYNDDGVTPKAIVLNFSTYTLSEENVLTAGKPFLIKTSKSMEGFNVCNVKISNSLIPTETVDNGIPGKFVGTFVNTKVPANALFINNGQLWYSKGKSVVKAFRGWFELGAVLGQEGHFSARLQINVDGETTAIGEIDRARNVANGNVYNLSGLRSSKAGGGVYIIDGKKYVKK